MMKDIDEFYNNLNELIKDLTTYEYFQLAEDLNHALNDGLGLGSDIIGEIRLILKNYNEPKIFQKDIKKRLKEIYKFTSRYFKF